MKALVKSRPSPGVWMENVPEPTVGTNEVLIRILKTGICGTDVHIVNWDEWAQRNIRTPVIIGHEFVGEIVATGPGVYGYQIGDRVSAEGHITCGVCRNCRVGKRHLCEKTVGIGGGRDGAFAEFLVMPAANVWEVGDHMPLEIGAILDPFGNAVHSALSFDLVGEDVLITGAGPVGIMTAGVCRFAGARHVVITDINDTRLALALKMGASRTVNVLQQDLTHVMGELGIVDGFDVGLEMSGNPQAFNSMLDAMCHGGHIGLLGFLPKHTEVQWDRLIFKGLRLKGIYGREMFETWYRMSRMLQAGFDLSPVITHRFPIEDYQAAFEVACGGGSGKVILEWDL